MKRVKGVKAKTAARLSAEGLTVNGEAYDAATPPAKVAKTERVAKAADKPAAKP